MIFVVSGTNAIIVTSGDNIVVLLFEVLIFTSIYFDVIILMTVNLTLVCLVSLKASSKYCFSSI